MNSKELKQFIDEALFTEVKSTILSENKKKEVYHIVHDGKPLATFDSKKDAQIALPNLKKKHRGKLIIEKAIYESYSDMIERFDEMTEDLGIKKIKENKTETMESFDNGGSFESLKQACDEMGCKKVAMKLVDSELKKHSSGDVSIDDISRDETLVNTLDEIEFALEREDFEQATEMASSIATDLMSEIGFDMADEEDPELFETEVNEQWGDDFFDEPMYSDDEDEDEFTSIVGRRKDDVISKDFEDEDEEEVGKDFSDDSDVDVFDGSAEDGMEDEEEDSEEEVELDDEGMEDEEEENSESLNEAASKDMHDLLMMLPALAPMLGVHLVQAIKKKIKAHKEGEDGEDKDTKNKEAHDDSDEDLEEEVKGMCSECGKMVTEEGSMCSECMSMKESKGRKVKMKESQLRRLVKNMITEAMKGKTDTAGVVGKTIANRAAKGSKKDAQQHYKEVEKKMKDYLGFDGNTNPEFPHQIGGDRMAIHPTDEQAAEIAKNRAGLQNLKYDNEPSENFKKRLEDALYGDSKMGNSSVTGKNSIETSNGAKAVDSEHKSGNTIATKTDKYFKKQIADRKKDRDERVLYNRAAVPTKQLSESVDNELEKMKRLLGYNKKTQ